MKRQSKLLLVAVPLIVLLSGAVAYQYGYRQVQTELAAREDAAAVKLKLLQKYRSLIAAKPRLEAELAALREARQAQEAKIIAGQTASIAAATLQSNLDALIASMGGTIASKRVEKIEDAGEFKVITVTVETLLPDARALSDTLYAIESQTPSLAVRELEVRIRTFKEPRELSVKLKVSGLTGGVPS